MCLSACMRVCVCVFCESVGVCVCAALRMSIKKRRLAGVWRYFNNFWFVQQTVQLVPHTCNGAFINLLAYCVPTKLLRTPKSHVFLMRHAKSRLKRPNVHSICRFTHSMKPSSSSSSSSQQSANLDNLFCSCDNISHAQMLHNSGHAFPAMLVSALLLSSYTRAY